MRKHIKHDTDIFLQKLKERENLKKELIHEAQRFVLGYQTNAEEFVKLLKAYSLWSEIPPRRKFTISAQVNYIYQDDNEFVVVMYNRRKYPAIKGIAELLYRSICRSDMLTYIN